LKNKIKTVPIANNSVYYDALCEIIDKAQLSSAEIDKLITLCDNAIDTKIEDKGTAPNAYTHKERQQILAIIDKACEVSNLTYTAADLTTEYATFTVYQPVYDNDGKVVGKKTAFVITPNTVAKTGINEFNSNYLYLLAGLALAVTAVSVIIIKKKISE